MRKLLLPRGAVNAVYLPYLQSSRRYQIFFGGASSGKSCFLATRAVLDTLQGRSTLVIRQVARTLRTSCWNEIGKAAARLGLTGCFRFNKTEMSVTADEAIAGALRGAGDTLSAAVQGHDVQLGGALAEAQQAMAAALQSAVNKLSASLNVNVPVYIDSTRVANAVVNQVRRRLVSGGRSLA